MEPEVVIDLMQETLQTGLFLVMPPLLIVLVVGLTISIVQAVTSIQEQTMVFIPKILAAILALLLLMPYIVATMMDYTIRLIESMPDVAR